MDWAWLLTQSLASVGAGVIGIALAWTVCSWWEGRKK